MVFHENEAEEEGNGVEDGEKEVHALDGRVLVDVLAFEDDGGVEEREVHPHVVEEGPDTGGERPFVLGEPTVGDVYLGGVGTGGSSQDAGLAEADEHEAEQRKEVVLLGDEFEPGAEGGEEGSEDESEVEPELERLDGEGSEVEVGDVVGGAEPDDGVL